MTAPDELPWQGKNLPGSTEGCTVAPESASNEARVVSDHDGVFFASNIDLVLRSHAVRSLVLVGGVPVPFAECVAHFAKLRGYSFIQLPVDRARELEALWSRYDQGRSSQEAGWEAGELLATLAERIDPRHAALMLIDVQNDFCHPRGAVGWSNDSINMIQSATERIKALLDAARSAGIFVVHVRAEYGTLYRNSGSPYRFPAMGRRDTAVWTASAADLSADARFDSSSVEVCLPGSWGGQFVDGIAPQSDEAVVTKHRFSAFVDTGLDLMLRARGIRTVITAGVTTNCCVESTVREAAMRDFYVVVPEDCVAVKDKLADLHEASLESIRLYFGQVRSSTDLIAVWDRMAIAHAAGNSAA